MAGYPVHVILLSLQVSRRSCIIDSGYSLVEFSFIPMDCHGEKEAGERRAVQRKTIGPLASDRQTKQKFLAS